MFKGVVFVITEKWKQPTLTIIKWIKTLWFIPRVQYYIVVKMNNVQLYISTWINHINITLNEKSKSHETT